MIDIPAMWLLVVVAVGGAVVFGTGLIYAGGNGGEGRTKALVFWVIVTLIGGLICGGSVAVMIIADSACCNTCC